jgi:hypothetical protein
VSDIERIRIIHELTQSFDVSADVVDGLRRQVSEPLRQNIDRFFRGLEVEDLFTTVFQSLPWTTLAHGLGQKQFPLESKAAYQVPDVVLFCEAGNLEHYPLLVDAKRVTGQKKSCELMPKQVDGLLAYADRIGHPLLFAIYWDIAAAWTLNTPDSFEKKASTLKLRIENAAANNCSMIAGDISFLIPRPFDASPYFHRKLQMTMDAFILTSAGRFQINFWSTARNLNST